MDGTFVFVTEDLFRQLSQLVKQESRTIPILLDELVREALELRGDREAIIAEFERERCPF